VINRITQTSRDCASYTCTNLCRNSIGTLRQMAAVCYGDLLPGEFSEIIDRYRDICRLYQFIKFRLQVPEALGDTAALQNRIEIIIRQLQSLRCTSDLTSCLALTNSLALLQMNPVSKKRDTTFDIIIQVDPASSTVISNGLTVSGTALGSGTTVSNVVLISTEAPLDGSSTLITTATVISGVPDRGTLFTLNFAGLLQQ